MREKESEGKIERERGREIFPHRLEKPTPHQPGTVGASGGGGGVEETRGGLRERRKEGARRVTQGGLGGGWGRQPQKYTATTPRGSTAEAAIFHRRTETRPRELKHPILPPRRSCPATSAKQRPGEESPSPRRRRQPLSLDEGDVPTGSRDPRAEKFFGSLSMCAHQEMHYRGP